MPRGTLDDRYLHWLYSQVADVKPRRSRKTYWDLLKQMYKTEFIWFVPNDRNRATDGIELRYEWVSETCTTVTLDWVQLDCSFLEMLIALCRRASFQSDLPADEWFWHILENLGFTDYNDRDGVAADLVEMRIRTVNQRLFEKDGLGGMFPLRDTSEDQRTVEIWYQLCEYILQDL